jgi:hypothetical protein
MPAAAAAAVAAALTTEVSSVSSPHSVRILWLHSKRIHQQLLAANCQALVFERQKNKQAMHGLNT